MNSSHDISGRARTGWGLLLVVLAVEAFGGLAAMVPITSGFLAATDDPLGPRVSIFLAALISWAWVLITLWGAARTKASWARGSAITLHVLIFAAGTGVLQLGGLVGGAGLGWGLVALALFGFVAALLAQPVVAQDETGAAGD